MSDNKQVFISHVHEERSLGSTIKTWVEDSFLANRVAAFLSSDRDNLPAGRKWLDVIENQLKETGVMISVLSPASLARPWVNIELGAAWIKHIPVIPLCHSRLVVNSLPRPFSDFNAVSLAQDDAAERLIGGVADGLKLACPRRLHFADFLKDMRTAADTANVADAVNDPRVAGYFDLPPEQIAILRTLAQVANDREEDILEDDAYGVCDLKPAIFKYHARQLHDAHLIHVSYYGPGAHYSISPDGSGWLIKNKQMPE